MGKSAVSRLNEGIEKEHRLLQNTSLQADNWNGKKIWRILTWRILKGTAKKPKKENNKNDAKIYRTD